MHWYLLAANEVQAMVMIVFALMVLMIGIGLFALVAKFFWLWIQAVSTGASIGLWDLFGMWVASSGSSNDCSQQDHGSSSWTG